MSSASAGSRRTRIVAFLLQGYPGMASLAAPSLTATRIGFFASGFSGIVGLRFDAVRLDVIRPDVVRFVGFARRTFRLLRRACGSGLPGGT